MAPGCGYTFDQVECAEVGEHFCVPRADRACAFIEEVCVHTKSVYARRRFRLEDWQRDGIIRPLFGEVRYDGQWKRYVRRYTIAHICLGRGNGKSELAAAIVLLLLVGDDEESAEIYGAAKDSKQAGKVGEVVRRMYELSPVLNRRLIYNRQARRLIDPRTNSYYEVITSDAKGELGHNASGAVIDELLTQATPELYDTLRTAQGKRPQSMLLGFTTASNDPSGFLATLHTEMQRVADDPNRAPHIFTFIRTTPPEQDPWDEANWYYANPGLGRFLSIETLRQEAVEARNDPTKENTFRQFRLNQFVQQATRFIPLHLWDACQGEVMLRPDWMVDRLRGSVAYAGLDLSAKFDLTAWCLIVPSGDRLWALWRFWLPEAAVADVDARLGGKLRPWIREGWLTPTEGETIDYESIYAQIAHDASVYHLRSLDYDPWSGEAVMQEVRRRTRLRDDQTIPIPQTYAGMTGPMTELMSSLKDGLLCHAGNPVARWNADSVEVKSPTDNPDLVRPVKPQRGASGKRVDGVVALALALGGWKRATARSYDVLESVM